MFKQDVAELGQTGTEVFSRKDCSTLFYQAISLFHSANCAQIYCRNTKTDTRLVKFIILIEIIRFSPFLFSLIFLI